MRFSAEGLAEALDGHVIGPDVTIDGVATDTRQLHPGQLFVPLRDRRDGHSFIGAAIEAGAVAYLTDGATSPGATAIVVADTARALTAVGGLARGRMDGRVVGVTGSVGKTTVKELARGAFASTYRTQASPLSYNNEIGLPLTLANADDDVEVVVAELGARGPGHIAALCRLARPSIGIISRIGLAHTEFLGSLEQVASAKAELVEALPPTGVAVLNGDDPFTRTLRRRAAAPVLVFGTGPGCDVVARDVRLGARAQAAFRLSSPWGDADVRLALHGTHQVENALAAAAAALWAGVRLEDVVASLAQAGDPPMRMNLSSPAPGIVLVNDTYNANPTSAEAALRTLGAIEAERRVAVLGAMAELGEGSEALHRSVGALAQSLGIVVIGYQAPAYGGVTVGTAAELLDRLGGLGPGDAILVKGSRVSGMEAVVASLQQAAQATAGSPTATD
ncbi:MAG: UDP-N-acetylmuramoyl-tripeptide--D-alanyl-D-alanine ligase [Acidimicrobiales bacterium]